MNSERPLPTEAGIVETGTISQNPLTDTVDRAPIRAWYILLVLIIATLFGAVDRQIMVVLAEAIKHDLVLSDGQLGIVQGLGPGLLAAPGIIFLGWLCDRMPRQLLLGIAVLIWSIATATFALAQSFHDLILSSVAIGLGEAALAPIIYSILPDVFPGRSRLMANMVYYGAVTIGSGFGIAFSGTIFMVVQTHGSELPLGLNDLSAWRVAFIAAAAPGLPLAAIVAALGAIPRASIPTSEPSHNTLVSYLRRHWSTFTALLATMFSFGVAAVAISTWAPVYIIRTLGASPSEVGFGFGAVLTCSAVLGILVGTIALRQLVPMLGQIAPLRILQIGLFSAALPLLALLFATRPWEAYLLIGGSLACVTAATSMLPTILQDLSPPQTRGRLMSVITLLFHISTGLGPIFVGLVSDQMPHDSRGLLWAIVGIAVPAFLAAGVILRLGQKAFRFTLDELAGAKPPEHFTDTTAHKV